ncbi:DUF805 domain-containing protein [Nocardioides speluncae]|uniref:DUF805 domain-containing protein n=1 Tax=Nocardioides speluncae TaxID=2670337 RepID=UPI000D6855A9|nr:DUF805 domain-containing protein [Nocardioides speluncae]
MDQYIGVLKNYTKFDGRAGRNEFWMFFLFHVIIFVVLSIIDSVVLSANGFGILSGLYWLGTIVPSIAVGIRRFHDIGKPGIWILLGLIPCVGGLVLLYFYAQESVGPNEYGEGPSAAAA